VISHVFLLPGVDAALRISPARFFR
jgi:hypothetical protein